MRMHLTFFKSHLPFDFWQNHCTSKSNIFDDCGRLLLVSSRFGPSKKKIFCQDLSVSNFSLQMKHPSHLLDSSWSITALQLRHGWINSWHLKFSKFLTLFPFRMAASSCDGRVVFLRVLRFPPSEANFSSK